MNTVATASAKPPTRPNDNIVVLRGILVGAPSTRQTPAGPLSDAILRVQAHADGASKHEQVPLVWNGELSRFPGFDATGGIVVLGRVRQRFFRSGQATVSRTEVVVEHIVPANRRASTIKLLTRLADELVAIADRKAAEYPA